MTVRPKSSPRQVESAEDLCIYRADASSVSPCHTCRWRHRRADDLPENLDDEWNRNQIRTRPTAGGGPRRKAAARPARGGTHRTGPLTATRRPRHTSGRGQAGRPADRGGRLFSCTVALKPETTVAYLDGELDMSTAVSHDPFGPLAKTGGREAMAVTTFEDLQLADRSHH